MEPIVLTRSQARKIILHAAGLSKKAQFGAGIEAVYKAIDHLGYVQLDTNYVVERAHHHALFARVPDYEPTWLAGLCENGDIFEYFTSDAGYLPTHEFRFSLPVMEAFQTQYNAPIKREADLMEQILDQVERDGAVMVGDFENDRQEASTGWWDWRPAKVALERLYLEGKLMIKRNSTFQKVYHLPLDVIPADTDQSMPAPEEYAQYVIRRTLGALGISSVKEMAWRSRRVKGNLVKKELEKMLQNGDVHFVNVEGIKGPLYMLSGTDINVSTTEEVFILSPFDILNVFRFRLKEFFDFDYQIECFVPAPKRKYGYFSLPILSGEKFIARMDAKADRKQKLLIIHNLHFEEVDIDEKTIDKFVDALKDYIIFNKCRDITFKKSNNSDLLAIISERFLD
ncbi:winged helix-turn-helix domain-containing protein [Pedobacter miscanthi]|uniref:Winged helix-turn-helix domain-containing protein n=1 Tax=Pedobacter miscanthi TaxID=2259170 RepID=A0A366KYD2_9SPHI|nr:crosslink repair DNA glycosylase YcaQ family protein [Pedobacter miscanthi]RBQ06655.1 winged helix-turn-helix domain-containing protein [Pedobacter miscanthi]